jgi:hypothetical protein
MRTGGPRPDLNGSLFIDEGTKAAYLVDQGCLRHVPDPYTFTRLFGGSGWERLRKLERGQIPFGKPISKEAYVGRDNQSGKYYFIALGVKRLIGGESTLQKYHFEASKAIPISADDLDKLLDGPEIK